ncbi:FtsX-like permease family protein [Bacteroides caecigallinarum]|jgi:cell division transport system permease protein|uniref:cell division protein FtsX n=1 Tax=Bacteroides TaxID=816 RepID=UPI00082290CD|nr:MULTISPECIES: permease-like cell division protein FtsX [Bacteroides]MBM6960137.1 FtsX-like permease family protein [Bacteroides caecigallinarum]MCU6772849.1 permease-like cell division protein FtsX [Bacteroides cellulolyticus]MDN0053725.1 permease-like cell division protein FtsX [Bacteroides caecigallinarum]MDN0072470.1 permease-like cell division protein FtsX [Bacteroides caecigallinarum]SCI62228.1 Cell division protein FtsX [uncultured Bacteroides sp.]
MRKHKSIFDMQFITAGISTTMVLFLLGLVVFFVLTANNLSVYIRENIAFSAILDDGIKETSIIKLQESLNKKDYVKQTVYISKDQALKEQIEAMGTDPSEFLGHNPFNASIEIKLNAGYTNPDSIKWIEKELMANKSILEISYPQNLLDSVNRNLQKISAFLLGLAVLLSLISFSLINNTIRLTIYSKRFLIHTMKLVGASWGFIRRPFITRNLWIGILSGAVANAILTASAYTAVKYEPELLAIVSPKSIMIVAAAVMVFGMIITTLCAYISINKYLRMKISELY